MGNALSIQGLSKKYGDFQALKDLNLTIERGQCLGILGSNGAGKSTTIRMITGQIRPSEGEIRVFGINPSLEPKKVHPFIGYIPDSQSLYENLTVWDNIHIFTKLFGAGEQETMRIIEQMGLVEKKYEKVKNLSKGLGQRVLIARALVHNPKFVILDEPTTGLDPSAAESIYSILEDLKKRGTTILLTTHLMNDVDRLCDQIVFISHGKKIEEGAPEELKAHYGLKLEDIFIKIVGKES